jgi:hypothetical protein
MFSRTPLSAETGTVDLFEGSDLTGKTSSQKEE